MTLSYTYLLVVAGTALTMSWRFASGGDLSCLFCEMDEFTSPKKPEDGPCQEGTLSTTTTISNPNGGPHEYCVYEDVWNENATSDYLKLRRYKYSTAEEQEVEVRIHTEDACVQESRGAFIYHRNVCNKDKCNHWKWNMGYDSSKRRTASTSSSSSQLKYRFPDTFIMTFVLIHILIVVS